LLNNELYIGRLVWNRLRYVKDPQTGRAIGPPITYIDNIPKCQTSAKILYFQG
jgi:hypothetical protein